MIEQQALKKFTAIIVLSSLFFIVLEYFDIQSSFYLWEFFFEGKVLLMTLIVIFFWRKRDIVFSSKNLLFLKFDWKKNVMLFMMPLIFFGFAIFVGLLAQELEFHSLDNTATLMVATIFDIPAMFVFSVTTLFLEEAIFRGILFPSFLSVMTPAKSILLSGMLWFFYGASAIVGLANGSFWSYSAVFLYFFSVGLFCSAIVLVNKSIFLSYSFRVGLLSLTPLMLSSVFVESDPFFTTSSIFFNAEGIVVSIALVAATRVLMKRFKPFVENTPI